MKERRILYIILAILAVFPIPAVAIINAFWKDAVFNYDPLPAMIEAMGALAAIMMTGFLLQMKTEKYGGRMFLVAMGFLGMGILGLFHAVSESRPGSVLLHSAASISGGLWFGLAWSGRLSLDRNEEWKKAAPYFVAFAAAAFGAGIMLFGETPPPAMVPEGRFTPSAITFSLAAGIFFLLATSRFILDFRQSGNLIAYFFACLSILFGTGEILFYYSVPWNPVWWLHHLLRLFANAAVLPFVIYQYLKDKNEAMEAQRKAEKELKKAHEELEQKVMERTGELRKIKEELEAEIAGRIKIEEESRKLEARLRHVQRMEAIGNLAGGVAHDFNNNLNVIMGFGSLVLDGLQTGSPLRGYMQEVLTAADKSANLTKRLLAFSKKQIMEVKPVDVNDIIGNLKKMLGRFIGEDIELSTDLADTPLTVMADEGQMEQVLINLATNARDAMPKGGRLTVGTGIREIDEEYVAAFGHGKPGRYALIAVSDTGSGMDAETRERIFEPFFTTKGIGEGSGLGLSICYGIVKQHDGHIQVCSEPGKGTTFNIYLPLVEATAISGPVAASTRTLDGTETILLAEDEAPLRRMLRILLESFGYIVITAEDGEDAVAKFKENRATIKLLISDMIMPKKSGKDAYDEIKKDNPGVKALFISGYTMDIIKTEDLIKGGLDILNKPVSQKDLLKKVREILDR